MNQNNNFIPSLPSIPIDLQVRLEPTSTAQAAAMLFIAILLALMIFGFVFKR